MGGGLSGMDAIHAGVQEDLQRRADTYDRSVLELDLRNQLEREAGSWAVKGALEQLVETLWPNHPLSGTELYPLIKAAGVAAWRRTRSWDAVGKAGRAFDLPPFDYAKPFTQELERNLFSSQFHRGEAERKATTLEAEVAEQKAEITKKDEEIARLRAELAGSERDLARHMTIEHAFRARLEQLDPHSALVRDTDTRVRLADHGYEVFKTTGDWAQVKEIGRSFVDFQFGAGSAFGSDEVVPPTDVDVLHAEGNEQAELGLAAGEAVYAAGEGASHSAVEHVEAPEERSGESHAGPEA